MNGKIIAFEGLDCSFKETNAKALYEHILKTTDKVAYFSFPRYDKPESLFVKNYLSGKYADDPSNINWYTGTIFYMVDQYDSWKTEIQPLYEQGYTIINDRFWTSSVYHQASKGYRGGKDKLDVIEARARIQGIFDIASRLGIPYPDKIFLMSTHFDVIAKLLRDKNSESDIHESKLNYIKGVYDFYNSAAFLKKMSNYSIIRTTDARHRIKSKEEIFEDILKNLG